MFATFVVLAVLRNGVFACANFAVSRAATLVNSFLTMLRNSALNCAPGCVSLFTTYSILGASSFCEPIPAKTPANSTKRERLIQRLIAVSSPAASPSDGQEYRCNHNSFTRWRRASSGKCDGFAAHLRAL